MTLNKYDKHTPTCPRGGPTGPNTPDEDWHQLVAMLGVQVSVLNDQLKVKVKILLDLSHNGKGQIKQGSTIRMTLRPTIETQSRQKRYLRSALGEWGPFIEKATHNQPNA
ncbi:hypothetical protein DPX16_10018 [Anabarilius grahami]|uniref:Uncharacterized protein n=1 Tax=Anabarilius grahami TaxID=495550 RepID=A0A3N0XWN7_ANAGA|nr:hypothetical protein DPX16_10018 [Anabarilius grahami]